MLDFLPLARHTFLSDFPIQPFWSATHIKICLETFDNFKTLIIPRPIQQFNPYFLENHLLFASNIRKNIQNIKENGQTQLFNQPKKHTHFFFFGIEYVRSTVFQGPEEVDVRRK